MRGFRFRLERLLHVRDLQEHASREAWAQAVRHAQEAQSRLDGARSVRKTALEDLSEKSGRPLERIALEASLDGIEALLQRRREQLHEAQKSVGEAHAVWIADRARVEGLDRLRENHKAAHGAAEQQRENAVMDEVSSSRDAQRIRPGADETGNGVR